MSARVSACLALVAVAGCVSYTGGARSVDPSRLEREPGWIVAAPTPELRQEGAKDCGPAALAMIAGRWQVTISVEQVARVMPPMTKAGARLGDLRDAARLLGFRAFVIAGDRDTLVYELRAGRPVLVGLVLPYGKKHAMRHYEVVVAVNEDDGQFVTIDPARGWRTRSWAELDAEWRPAGRPALVVLGPSPR